MAAGFTGFPSRGGHFGIRRLNVSHGLGPEGKIVARADGTPGAKVKVLAPDADSTELTILARGEVLAPDAVLTPFGFVLRAEVEAYLARAEPSHPLARASAVAPYADPSKDCASSEGPPGARAAVSAPSATTTPSGARARVEAKGPRTAGASQGGGHEASSTERKPTTKAAKAKAPTSRKKK